MKTPILSPTLELPLHRIGWLAFQDLCAAIAGEVLNRPIQTFLPTGDGGRDGAFIGSWDKEYESGTSTIQCKFTAKENQTLSLSMLTEELHKAKNLSLKGLANDYVIMTNHTITGKSEGIIKEAFEYAGVGCCRVFHKDWIINQIRNSPKLRMLVPRLYGLGDFSDLLNAKAYDQAQIILSEVSDSLEKLVVTKAYKDSVKAINEHSLVLLLGSPAVGKSTIAASLALGAADSWNCLTIKTTSPEHLHTHIDPRGGQFFWIDDAWGSTQYQADRIEAWNQTFPLMQAVLKKGTKFLITSRDYIWERAKKDLKLQALPALNKNQVIIKVQNLKQEEKARILYNHLKFGTQPPNFIKKVKPFLPAITRLTEFLPESARRLGNPFFTTGLWLNEENVLRFFTEPKGFLNDILENLETGCLAAIALIFLNGGKIRSPISTDYTSPIAKTFSIDEGKLKSHLEALKDSILLLAYDEQGPYWTYKHPTMADSFSSLVAKSPEMIDIYLKGAKPDSMLEEVVCAGSYISGPVIVPDSLHNLFADRIANTSANKLRAFISYRANAAFATLLIGLRPDILPKRWLFSAPLSQDSDVRLFAHLYKFKLITEEERLEFVKAVHSSIEDDADASFISNEDIRNLLTSEEMEICYSLAETVLKDVSKYIEKLKDAWDEYFDPSIYFDLLKTAVSDFAIALLPRLPTADMEVRALSLIDFAIGNLLENYNPTPQSIADSPQSLATTDSIEELFRDIDD